MKYPAVSNFINGELISGSNGTLDVYSPLDGSVISQVPISSSSELDKAVDSARNAFKPWSQKPIKERVQVFFKYRNLLEENIEELTNLVSEENGKTYSEAKAEVLKSIELTEFACSMPQLVAGEVLEVSKGVECRIEKFPVGVIASVTPFNFPNMFPN
ncbi:MAG: aldehyde dehydrogenase family protein, partial [Bacteroidetes bacterium]|nr:aldehyde dehydrogenase family protein [Bacteroidota bacterium]